MGDATGIDKQGIIAEEIFQSLVRFSGLPPHTRETHRPDRYVIRQGNEAAVPTVQEFADGKAQHPFLTLVGPTGTGKTHLAFGIAWEWLESGRGKVKYYQTESLLDELRAGFHLEEFAAKISYDRLLHWLKTVDLLVLDDLGAEHTTEWARAKLDEIIDHRYLYERYTVFTTNLGVRQLETRVASRIQEGVVVVLKCGDYRLVKAGERMRKK